MQCFNKEDWVWSQTKYNCLSNTHIPVKQNVEVDLQSRKNEVRVEWKLRETVFHYICRKLNSNPKIDLFAYQLNIQLGDFVS